MHDESVPSDLVGKSDRSEFSPPDIIDENTVNRPLYLNKLVEETFSACKRKGLDSNRVDILRCLQKN